MSRFICGKLSRIAPYVPGEQPRDKRYIKLNTNESPFPPSPRAVAAASQEAARLELYSDPDCTQLVKTLAKRYAVNEDEIVCVNGSDEVLNFAFKAFCDAERGAAFPDITYGFYKVFAEFHDIPYEQIPLNEDFTIDIKPYLGINKTVFIANPNAPTGIALSTEQIEEILSSNPDNLIVIDEAYVDFGCESCVPLIKKYDNLLVTQTFSKSRSLAGARLGFGIANPAIIRDLNTVRFSTNPYNVNRMTLAAGAAALEDEEYTQTNCRVIIENREYTARRLAEMGFKMTPSSANFLFARHPGVSGITLYLKLKERGVLIRHFDAPRICEYNRITVGTKEQMDTLLNEISKILEEET